MKCGDIFFAQSSADIATRVSLKLSGRKSQGRLCQAPKTTDIFLLLQHVSASVISWLISCFRHFQSLVRGPSAAHQLILSGPRCLQQTRNKLEMSARGWGRGGWGSTMIKSARIKVGMWLRANIYNQSCARDEKKADKEARVTSRDNTSKRKVNNLRVTVKRKQIYNKRLKVRKTV